MRISPSESQLIFLEHLGAGLLALCWADVNTWNTAFTSVWIVNF